MFLFTDSQIVDEKMLVYVNDLLSSGEIPDLFAQEDKDEIINAVRSETKALGLVDTAENCWSTFIQKVNSERQHVMAWVQPSSWHIIPTMHACTYIALYAVSLHCGSHVRVINDASCTGLCLTTRALCCFPQDCILMDSRCATIYTWSSQPVR